ncbi:MAG: biotin/lipoyl-containing protein [Candidatus Bathyarchaeia archaeon]
MKLPTYEISINGKTRRIIEIVKTGEKSFTVKLKDKTFDAEFPTGRIEFGRKLQIKVDGKLYSVALEKFSEAKPFTVKVEEASFKVELRTPMHKRIVTVPEQVALTPIIKAAKPMPGVSGTVTAPMTGKILSIKVRKGEHVKAGQVLCILEAMKMENEITAPVAGAIREIFVSEGSPVNEGDPLFVIG